MTPILCDSWKIETVKLEWSWRRPFGSRQVERLVLDLEGGPFKAFRSVAIRRTPPSKWQRRRWTEAKVGDVQIYLNKNSLKKRRGAKLEELNSQVAKTADELVDSIGTQLAAQAPKLSLEERTRVAFFIFQRRSDESQYYFAQEHALPRTLYKDGEGRWHLFLNRRASQRDHFDLGGNKKGSQSVMIEFKDEGVQVTPTYTLTNLIPQATTVESFRRRQQRVLDRLEGEFTLPKHIRSRRMLRPIIDCGLHQSKWSNNDVEVWKRRVVFPRMKSLHEERRPDLKRVMRQAIEGLCDIQRAGFIHRDIKPANFMLDPDGNLYYSDFGTLCRQNASHEELHRTVGTEHYRSPECSHQSYLASINTDVYALGRTFEWLLRGQSLSDSMRRLLDGMLAADPNDRFTPEQVKRAFHALPSR